MSAAVLSLVRGRERHLANMLAGLACQTRPADETVVAYMQDDPPAVSAPLPVRFVPAPGEPMPLAAARNRAARASGADVLIFLDVDCVPHDGLVEAFCAAVEPGRVVMGDARYLSETDDASGAFETLWAGAKRHPARPAPEDGEARPLSSMNELWSLCFALPRDLFETAGGFDEAFTGYGGEETDFAARLDALGAKLWFAPQARAVHQWHAVDIPPLKHFDAIIANARRFRDKHGRWCMEYWLGQFAAAGYVDWREDAERLEVLRRPTRAERDAARQPGDVLYS
ncbi:MAG: glycosyltransferase family 2 protein [Oceanicaulis sp.]